MAYDSQEIFGAVGALIFVIDAQVLFSMLCYAMLCYIYVYEMLVTPIFFDRMIIVKPCIGYFLQ